MGGQYSPSATWREGYYEGATEEGGRVLFFVPSERYFVPSKSNMIARFQVELNISGTSSTEGEYGYTSRFEAEEVGIVDGGFAYSHVDGGQLFGLNGLLRPNGEATGMCIGLENGWSGGGGSDHSFAYGFSQWMKWEAVWKTTEDDLNAPLFLP